ncbi:MAG TPA: hypothetical protein PK022_04950 [Syntrophales bacterium]|nr:hypothetical protein [Syntrophales bacterium]
MKRACLPVLALVIVCLIGCGSRAINYNATLSDLRCASFRSVAVAVLDARPYILKKQKEPNYVGLMRGGYGNPFDMWTESGAPLADDMLSTIVDSLSAKGFDVTPVKTSTGDSMNSVLAKLKDSQAERLLLVDMKEWYSDYLPKAFAAERSTLFINLEVTVFDRNQKKLAKHNLQEVLELPSGWPYDTIPDVYQIKFTKLLDDARICGTLK